MKHIFPESELIINADGSCFHLHVRPEQLAERIVLVSDPASVDLVAAHFDSKECEIESREFRTITGTYSGKRITCLSYGFGSENIDIVLNELDTLANIDYSTREEKDEHKVLTLVNIGISEGVQPEIKPGTIIASKKNIGYNIVPRNYFTYRHMSDDLIFHFNINTICDYGIVSTLYPVFTTTSEIDSQWLLYYLNHSVDIKKYALLQKQGGSRTYMYFSKLESLKAHIPALAEQKKISSLIFKIDEQIYFQQKKLKYLQKSKRFLLQNMFI